MPTGVPFRLWVLEFKQCSLDHIAQASRGGGVHTFGHPPLF
jgi:hypothetical protein